MKNPISKANRRDAIIAIVERKCRASGANKRQAQVATIVAVAIFNNRGTAHRAIKEGIARCELFIAENVTEPSFNQVSILSFSDKYLKSKRVRK